MKVTDLAYDFSTKIIIVGALTGVSLGFLGTVSDDHRTTLLYRKPYDATEVYHTLKITAQRLEWLHAVSIIIALCKLLKSADVYYFKISTLGLAMATGFFTALFIDIVFLLLYVDLEYYNFVAGDHIVPVLVLTIFVFLLLMTLLSRDQAAALFLWLAGYLCILYWQCVHQGSLYLDWSRATISLPGQI